MRTDRRVLRRNRRRRRAVLAKRIVGNEVIAYPELGAEAIARVEVVDFPAIVVMDCRGGDLCEEGRAQYAREAEGARAPART